MVSWLLTGAPEQIYWQNRETANVGLDSSVGRAPARQSGGRRFKSRCSNFFFVHPNLSTTLIYFVWKVLSEKNKDKFTEGSWILTYDVWWFILRFILYLNLIPGLSAAGKRPYDFPGKRDWAPMPVPNFGLENVNENANPIVCEVCKFVVGDVQKLLGNDSSKVGI